MFPVWVHESCLKFSKENDRCSLVEVTTVFHWRHKKVDFNQVSSGWTRLMSQFILSVLERNRNHSHSGNEKQKTICEWKCDRFIFFIFWRQRNGHRTAHWTVDVDVKGTRAAASRHRCRSTCCRLVSHAWPARSRGASPAFRSRNASPSRPSTSTARKVGPTRFAPCWWLGFPPCWAWNECYT